ncbi:DUF1513 domain-containing protein [Rhizobiales bacterium Sp-1]|uniref:DUF1513 domain-containing protein n=2 Tax=Segnochrobactrum spirostomi TaxID=2608987 RepID=A0A6A7Y514_9HYPH|nr:DUF1513 domain-containing protein [Segnochrobactrum spirostomi]
MRSMEIDRRAFLVAAAGAVAVLPSLGRIARAADAEPLYASCCKTPDGQFAVVILDAAGTVRRTELLAGRGHSLAMDRQGRWCVAFARRPGTFALAVDRASGTAVHAFETPSDRHFEGHGAFSPDGRLLYATENAFDDGVAVVGVYDATGGFRRIGELPGHGIGSHELLLAPDGRSLVVANGGIATHPDYPRAKLDLDAMEPSIAWIDRDTGDLVERVDPPAALKELSLRHMAVDAAGQAWIGCQWQGDQANPVPLLAVYRRGEPLAFVDLPDEARIGLQQYVGSVAADVTGRRIVIASPVGGTVLTFDAASRRLLAKEDLVDGCGAAPFEAGFLLTSGRGTLLREGGHGSERIETPYSWDNHIRSI